MVELWRHVGKARILVPAAGLKGGKTAMHENSHVSQGAFSSWPLYSPNLRATAPQGPGYSQDIHPTVRRHLAASDATPTRASCVLLYTACTVVDTLFLASSVAALRYRNDTADSAPHSQRELTYHARQSHQTGVGQRRRAP